METPAFKKRLEEDAALLKRIQDLQGKTRLTGVEEQEFKELHHQYYVTNEDIRRYWKTY